MPTWTGPALAAFLCWGVWAFLPKLTTRYLDPRSAILYEALGGLLVAAVILGLLAFRPAADMRGIGLALTTGALGVLGALAYLYAMQKGPVTLIATITALYPLLAILLAGLFLNESVSLRQGLGIVLALVSILLIAG